MYQNKCLFVQFLYLHFNFFPLFVFDKFTSVLIHPFILYLFLMFYQSVCPCFALHVLLLLFTCLCFKQFVFGLSYLLLFYFSNLFSYLLVFFKYRQINYNNSRSIKIQKQINQNTDRLVTAESINKNKSRFNIKLAEIQNLSKLI